MRARANDFLLTLLACAAAQSQVGLMVLETSGEVSSPSLLSAAISGAFAGEGLVVTGVAPTKTSSGYAIEVAPTDSVSVSTIVSKLSMCEYRTTLETAWAAAPYDLPDPSIVSVCEATTGATTCATTLSSCAASGDTGGDEDDDDDDDSSESGSGGDADASTGEGMEAGALVGIGIVVVASVAIVVVNLAGYYFF